MMRSVRLLIATFVGLLAATSVQAEESLPQLNPASYPSQIFWLMVSFIVLYVIVSRMALPRISQILHRRMRSIDADYSSARKSRREVETLVGEMDKILEEGRQEAQELLRNKHQVLQADLAEKQDRAAQAVSVEIGEFEQKIADAKSDALEKIDQMAAELTERCVLLAGGSKPTKAVLKSALED